MESKKYNWELPTCNELTAIIEGYATHKEQWQEEVKSHFSEEDFMSIDYVAEDLAAYGTVKS